MKLDAIHRPEDAHRVKNISCPFSYRPSVQEGAGGSGIELLLRNYEEILQDLEDSSPVFRIYDGLEANLRESPVAR